MFSNCRFKKLSMPVVWPLDDVVVIWAVVDEAPVVESGCGPVVAGVLPVVAGGAAVVPAVSPGFVVGVAPGVVDS